MAENEETMNNEEAENSDGDLGKMLAELFGGFKKYEDERKSMFPLTIDDIKMNNCRPIMSSRHIGEFVSIRPCAEEYGNKTFLGIYLGEMATTTSFSVDEEAISKEDGTKKKIMKISFAGGNPAIYVPSLKKVILGMESWWKIIKTPEEIQEITDKDIDSQFYVQALKRLAETEGKRDNSTAE